MGILSGLGGALQGNRSQLGDLGGGALNALGMSGGQINDVSDLLLGKRQVQPQQQLGTVNGQALMAPPTLGPRTGGILQGLAGGMAPQAGAAGGARSGLGGMGGGGQQTQWIRTPRGIIPIDGWGGGLS